MPRATVRAGARLHFGFTNLALAHERLYGGVGLALAEPAAVVTAEPADSVDADPPVGDAAERACDLLEVPGARVRVREALPRHVGLGSGTQHALAALAAIARAHGCDPRSRDRAPEMGRGGRSGVGVAAFERGGFLVDGGHPTRRFTAAAPARGEWTVPPVLVRHEIPDSWRVVLAVPTGTGRSGAREEESIRAVVESADPATGDALAALLVRRLLPAAAEGRLAAFGDAAAEFGRRNGTYYVDEQGGVYRPPAGGVIEQLRTAPAIEGVGQSSWGPTVWGLTDAARADAAREAARDALVDADVDGDVSVVRPRNVGAEVATGGGGGSPASDA